MVLWDLSLGSGTTRWERNNVSVLALLYKIKVILCKSLCSYSKASFTWSTCAVVPSTSLGLLIWLSHLAAAHETEIPGSSPLCSRFSVLKGIKSRKCRKGGHDPESEDMQKWEHIRYEKWKVLQKWIRPQFFSFISVPYLLWELQHQAWSPSSKDVVRLAVPSSLNWG